MGLLWSPVGVLTRSLRSHETFPSHHAVLLSAFSFGHEENATLHCLSVSASWIKFLRLKTSHFLVLKKNKNLHITEAVGQPGSSYPYTVSYSSNKLIRASKNDKVLHLCVMDARFLFHAILKNWWKGAHRREGKDRRYMSPSFNGKKILTETPFTEKFYNNPMRIM